MEIGERVLIRKFETDHSIVEVYTRHIERTPEEVARDKEWLHRLLARCYVRANINAARTVNKK